MLRSTILWGTMVTLSAGLLASVMLQGFLSAKAAVERTTSDLAECRRLAAQLGDRQPAAKADLVATRRLTEVAPYVMKSAESASIEAQSVVFIEPGVMTPLSEGSPFVRQAVHVQMEGVALPKLGRFLLDLESRGEDFRVEGMRLSAPRSSTTEEENWNGELALTCLVSSVIPPPPSKE